jgi:hypothetical protein
MTPDHKLQNPIALTEGGRISTVDEALDFYFSLPVSQRIERCWTEAAKLLVSALEEDGDAFLALAERQLRYALGRRAS